MPLPRSASGPSALSINTNSANSLFGSGTTPAAGGMFGNTAASKPGGLFGNSTTAAPATGGLFGSTAAATQPQTGGGLFGTATTPQSGGLFGSTPASQPQTGGLFGSTPATTQPATSSLFGSAQPQQPQSGGLFGNTSTTAQPATSSLFGAPAATSQPQQTGGLFGQQAQIGGGGLFGAGSTTQPAQGGGLFGNLNNQNQGKSASTLFGNPGSTTQNTQQQAQQPSMFANLNQNQNQGPGLMGSTTGGLSMGQSTQQQTVPGVRIDSSQVRGTSRYNDLHEDLQKQIEMFDNVIQGQIRLKNDCDAIMPAHGNQLEQVPTDVEFCRRKRIGVENAQDSDAQAISFVQKLIKVDAEHAKLSFKLVDNLKLPPQFHTTGIYSSGSDRSQTNGDSGAQDIVGFFSNTADELASTLTSYQKHIVEIEQHLRSVEANSAQQINSLVARRNGSTFGQENPMEELTGVLRDFETSMLGIAGKIGRAREGVQSLQLNEFAAPQNGQRNGNRRGLY